MLARESTAMMIPPENTNPRVVVPCRNFKAWSCLVSPAPVKTPASKSSCWKVSIKENHSQLSLQVSNLDSRKQKAGWRIHQLHCHIFRIRLLAPFVSAKFALHATEGIRKSESHIDDRCPKIKICPESESRNALERRALVRWYWWEWRPLLIL